MSERYSVLCFERGNLQEQADLDGVDHMDRFSAMITPCDIVIAAHTPTHDGQSDRNATMSGKQEYIFVLWGKGFDEIAAAIFVCELRRHGLLVKVVGIGGTKLPGSCGLALVPDMTLGEALPLASKARCVIVPCDHRYWRQLGNDPRTTNFFTHAGINRSWLVSEDDGQGSIRATYNKRFSQERILLYEHSENPVLHAKQLTKILEFATLTEM